MNANVRALAVSDIAMDVLRGLTSRPKNLPPKLFYDSYGSELFEQITHLPEYYLTSTELSIVEEHSEEMIREAGLFDTVIELGAGTARKTMLLLQAALRQHRKIAFVPVDISHSALEAAEERVRRELPQIAVHPQVLDYTRDTAAFRNLPGRKLVLYIGSSIGNFEPLFASALLRHLRQTLSPGDMLLLGVDMQKPESILLPAYNDSEGVTAKFNLNVLSRINRELGADFDLSRFEHRAIWNPQDSRIEMHLFSRGRQRVHIPALPMTVDFADGESIHTENSYKFTESMLESIALNSGFTRERWWTDDRGWFRVQMLRA